MSLQNINLQKRKIAVYVEQSKGNDRLITFFGEDVLNAIM